MVSVSATEGFGLGIVQVASHPGTEPGHMRLAWSGDVHASDASFRLEPKTSNAEHLALRAFLLLNDVSRTLSLSFQN